MRKRISCILIIFYLKIIPIYSGGGDEKDEGHSEKGKSPLDEFADKNIQTDFGQPWEWELQMPYFAHFHDFSSAELLDQNALAGIFERPNDQIQHSNYQMEHRQKRPMEPMAQEMSGSNKRIAITKVIPQPIAGIGHNFGEESLAQLSKNPQKMGEEQKRDFLASLREYKEREFEENQRKRQHQQNLIKIHLGENEKQMERENFRNQPKLIQQLNMANIDEIGRKFDDQSQPNSAAKEARRKRYNRQKYKKQMKEKGKEQKIKFLDNLRQQKEGEMKLQISSQNEQMEGENYQNPPMPIQPVELTQNLSKNGIPMNNEQQNLGQFPSSAAEILERAKLERERKAKFLDSLRQLKLRELEEKQRKEKELQKFIQIQLQREQMEKSGNFEYQSASIPQLNLPKISSNGDGIGINLNEHQFLGENQQQMGEEEKREFFASLRKQKLKELEENWQREKQSNKIIKIPKNSPMEIFGENSQFESILPHNAGIGMNIGAQKKPNPAAKEARKIRYQQRKQKELKGKNIESNAKFLNEQQKKGEREEKRRMREKEWHNQIPQQNEKRMESGNYQNPLASIQRIEWAQMLQNREENGINFGQQSLPKLSENPQQMGEEQKRDFLASLRQYKEREFEENQRKQKQ